MIWDKLNKIQNELNAPKNQYNKFGNYYYRSCEDILSAVKPLLLKYGLTLILSDEVVKIDDHYYVKAVATLYNNEDGNTETVSTCAYAREDESKKGMDGSQITGSASSYSRKYAMNGLFLTDDTKDADTNEQKQQETNAAKADKEPQKKKAPDLICYDCGEVIQGYTAKSGNKVDAETWVGNAIKMFGVPLCVPCANARADAE